MFTNYRNLDIFDYICAQNKHHYEHNNKIQGVYLCNIYE